MAGGESPYNTEEAIQRIIDTGKQPITEERSTSGVCIEETDTPYVGNGDFEPIHTPIFDENGNQIGFKIPENEDPDNLCLTPEELDSAFD